MSIEIFRLPTSNLGATRLLADPWTRVDLKEVYNKLIKDRQIDEHQLAVMISNCGKRNYPGISGEELRQFIQSTQRALSLVAFGWDTFCLALSVLGHEEIILTF